MNAGLKKGRERYMKLLKEGKIKKLNPLDKARENPTSLRKAVNAKCYNCCGGDNWINRTRYCNMFNCPLWSVRPYSKGITKEQCSCWAETGV